MTSARQRRQEAVERIRREYYGNIPEPSYGVSALQQLNVIKM